MLIFSLPGIVQIVTVCEMYSTKIKLMVLKLKLITELTIPTVKLIHSVVTRCCSVNSLMLLLSRGSVCHDDPSSPATMHSAFLYQRVAHIPAISVV